MLKKSMLLVLLFAGNLAVMAQEKLTIENVKKT